MRNDMIPRLNVGEEGSRVERGAGRIGDGRRVVSLVEGCHHDLGRGFEGRESRSFGEELVEDRRGESVTRSVVFGEEREDGRGRDEMFHKDRGEFDEIGGATSSSYVVIFRSTDHSCAD